MEGHHGPEGEVVEPGTCELAQARVEQYFTQLRETLLLQEAAARSAVDTHVRERLCSLRQLQLDLSMWLSQVMNGQWDCPVLSVNPKHYKYLFYMRLTYSIYVLWYLLY